MKTDFSLLIIALSGLVFSGLVSYVVIRELCRHAPRLGIIDQPDFRKVHKTPIPRIGGLGISAGFFAGVLFFKFAQTYCGELADVIPMPSPHLFTGAIVIAITGLVDDIHGINFRQKIVVQCLVAVYMILAGSRLNLNLGIFPGYADALSIPLTFFWIIGVTNAVNLIDGLDGLAGGVFLTSLLAVTIGVVLTGQVVDLGLVFCMTGAVLGFLFLNWNPAKVFMGDSGSLFLGYIIACYSLDSTKTPSHFFVFLVPVFAVGLPVFDTLLSMGRRALKGRPMFYPDKDHIHHRIQRVFGFNQRQTVYCLYGINAIFGLVSIVLLLVSNWTGLLVSLIGFGFFGLLLFRLKYISAQNIRSFLNKRSKKDNDLDSQDFSLLDSRR